MRCLLLFLLVAGCADPCYVRQVDGKYPAPMGMVTPRGTPYSGGDPLVIDRLVDEVEACLTLLDAHRCGTLPIDRGSFRVVVATDYTTDSTGEQTLPVYAGMGCKGMEGKCYWRAFLQPNRVIVTTPNMRLFKDPLVRMITGTQEIWLDPALARCAT